MRFSKQNLKDPTPWPIKKLAVAILLTTASTGSLAYMEKYELAAVIIPIIGILANLFLNFFSVNDAPRRSKKAAGKPSVK